MTALPVRLCLYCGSRPGLRPGFTEEARRLGALVAARGWRLVYGGGDVGLMGEAARSAMTAGAHVTGFIPRHIADLEVSKEDIHSLVVTETMHERKKLMLWNADAVVALPGGPGTLDELIEVLTWRHLGLHGKPAVLVNAGGYWDPLLALFERMVGEGFVGRSFPAYLTVVGSAAEAVEAVAAALARGPRSSATE